MNSNRCSVRQSSFDPFVCIFDFDPAALGGGGGASVCIDLLQGLASIAGVHKNVLMPRRSTGDLLAEGLRQTALPQPTVLEAYNVQEKTTAAALAAGGSGQGTLLGVTLANTVRALGGTLLRWEPVPDGTIFHLRVHIVYP